MTFEIDLSGRRAVVTGGGQGVGRGIAKALGAAGAEVFVNDLVEERAAGVVAEIEAAGGKGGTAVFDVTDFAAVQAKFAELGLVDILVNNAGNAGKADSMGFEEMKYFHEEDPAAWDNFMRVNLFGVMYVTRAALPAIITVVGLLFANILTGAVLVENIFAWPGIGQYAYQAAINLDVPAIAGVSLFIAVVYVTINFVVDVLYGVIDPRIRVM